MSEAKRSSLLPRIAPHIDPERGEEIVVEVLREGKVVACIYGTREGVQIVGLGDRRSADLHPFGLTVEGVGTRSVVVPLLLDREQCPWCFGSKIFKEQECPVCRGAS